MFSFAGIYGLCRVEFMQVAQEAVKAPLNYSDIPDSKRIVQISFIPRSFSK